MTIYENNYLHFIGFGYGLRSQKPVIATHTRILILSHIHFLGVLILIQIQIWLQH
ncbi:hypothetical protein [Scytonema hofmannii]|uniref:hypothetical protein n=1 Tax=Scytonema hofmannii TaxID=34078 RepID=UPI00034CAAF3|nr:hypothetical protein [Scytonema hofmannii]